MNTFHVPSNVARGCYQQHIVANGHIPGVLSGAELTGAAKQYGGNYHRSRRAVADRLWQHGVRNAVVFDPDRKRYVRVWVDSSGRRIRLAI